MTVAFEEPDDQKAPLGALIEGCDSIVCRCWGTPNAASKEILVGFGTEYPDTANNSFVLNLEADKDSLV
jgi:hypothetical protein